MSLDRLAEIRARVEAAPHGPWRSHRGGGPSGPLSGITNSIGNVIAMQVPSAHVEFIAHAREDIPYLLDLVAAGARREGPFRAALTEILRHVNEEDCSEDYIADTARAALSASPAPTPDARAASSGTPASPSRPLCAPCGHLESSVCHAGVADGCDWGAHAFIAPDQQCDTCGRYLGASASDTTANHEGRYGHAFATNTARAALSASPAPAPEVHDWTEDDGVMPLDHPSHPLRADLQEHKEADRGADEPREG